jgi:hypothetical protein
MMMTLLGLEGRRKKPMSDDPKPEPRIDLGGGNSLEPDPEPRDTQFHQTIVGTRPIPNARMGHFVQLACGHEVITFGKLEHAAGKILCTVCRAQAGT